jgi:hypothetical protein
MLKTVCFSGNIDALMWEKENAIIYKCWEVRLSVILFLCPKHFSYCIGDIPGYISLRRVYKHDSESLYLFIFYLLFLRA